MIMKCKKQFIALFMAISVIFCVGSETYIKADALEWAIPTITAGEAIKWLLGLLGVTVAGAAIADTDYEQLVENYNNYAEIKGQTAVETGKFWADIIDGALDTGSQAWANFKEWATSLVSSSTAPSVENVSNIFSSCPYSLVINNLSSYNNIDIDLSKAFLFYKESVNGNVECYILDNISNVELTSTSTGYNFRAVFNSTPVHKYYLRGSNIDVTTLNQGIAYGENALFSDKISFYPFSSLTGFNIEPIPWDINDGFSFNVYNQSLIDNIALTLSNAISDAIPDVIPLPWDQVSDTAEGINDKINELIEKVNEGVLSLEDYMVAIQSILGVIAFDTTTDLVIPSDPDLPDETIQDKVNENINNNGFVLSGLENFFPFCIPFDIYSFITILVAEPVAPVIHWHIYNPVTKTDNIMTLDFAMWEPVVILFRYIFDFLFIIGLALIARSLIGGDD